MNKKDVIVIGDGIAAWSLIHQVIEKTSFEVTQFVGDDYFRPCSLNSTSINCLRGTTRGISKLGDLICDSYDEFLAFNAKYRPQGVEKGLEVQFWNDHQKYINRYPNYKNVLNSKYEALVSYKYFFENEAYFLNPEKLKDWFIKSFSQKVERIPKLALKVESNNVITSDQIYSAKYIFVCTNGKSKSLLSGINKEYDYYINHSKPVSGSYLEAENFSLGHQKNPINFAFDKIHLIQRSMDNILQIGSTSNNRSQIELANEKELIKIYDQVKMSYKGELPSFESFKFKVGNRFKGYKRLPFWGKVDQNTFAINGLYKNAFSFSFLAAKDLLNYLKN